MQFVRPVRRPLSVPIVPLIDILVTLLFFFIVTQRNMTAKQPRPVIKVSLPAAGSLKVKTITTHRTVLSLAADGTAEIDGLAVPEGFLKEYLVANRRQRPGLKLEMRADEGCPWGAVLAAHGFALEAGYQSGDIVNRVRKQPATEN